MLFQRTFIVLAAAPMEPAQIEFITPNPKAAVMRENIQRHEATAWRSDTADAGKRRLFVRSTRTVMHNDFFHYI